MKLFWKIFFTVMIISISCFSIGSYILINNNFKSSLERDINTTFMENDILKFALTQELEDISELFIDFSNETINYTKAQWIEKIAPNINISSIEDLNFRVRDIEGKILYENTDTDVKWEEIAKIKENQRAHEVFNIKDEYFIHAVARIKMDKEVFYIENFKNITPLFISQKRQFETFLYVVVFMLLISGVVSFVVSWLILKPIFKLTRATKEISIGNYHQRVITKVKDETGELANNFNLMAENMEKTVGELKAVNERQETFIGSFAHEIKTPLTSMIGYADMLRSRKLSEEEVIVFSNYIFEEGKRIESLSMKLLDLIILKRRDFIMQEIFSLDYFEELEGIVYPSLIKSNITFTSCIDECVLKLEPELMKTVFINIIDNAIKAILRKEKNNDSCNMSRGEILLEGKQDKNNYIIVISDNGSGMEKEELSRITEAFYMVDKSRARSQGGAGLGLSICAEILEIQKGELYFESEVNKGTKVYIKLKGVVIDEER